MQKYAQRHDRGTAPALGRLDSAPRMPDSAGSLQHALSHIPAQRREAMEPAVAEAPAQLAKGGKKPMDGKSRLQRAHDRARRRAAQISRPPLGRRREVVTPFGTAGVSRGRGGQPYVTTRAGDFPGEQGRMRGDYASLGRVMRTKGLMPLVRESTKRSSKATHARSRHAATLSAIVTEAEEARFAGASKVFRSATRGVTTASQYATALGGTDPTFAMAARGGAKAYSRALAGQQELTKTQLDALANMSDSSDDDDDDG